MYLFGFWVIPLLAKRFCFYPKRGFWKFFLNPSRFYCCRRYNCCRCYSCCYCCGRYWRLLAVCFWFLPHDDYDEYGRIQLLMLRTNWKDSAVVVLREFWNDYYNDVEWYDGWVSRKGDNNNPRSEWSRCLCCSIFINIMCAAVMQIICPKKDCGKRIFAYTCSFWTTDTFTGPIMIDTIFNRFEFDNGNLQ